VEDLAEAEGVVAKAVVMAREAAEAVATEVVAVAVAVVATRTRTSGFL